MQERRLQRELRAEEELVRHRVRVAEDERCREAEVKERMRRRPIPCAGCLGCHQLPTDDVA